VKAGNDGSIPFSILNCTETSPVSRNNHTQKLLFRIKSVSVIGAMGKSRECLADLVRENAPIGRPFAPANQICASYLI
jgi:hypothetical protein